MLLHFTFVFKQYAATNLVCAISAFNVEIYLAMNSSSRIYLTMKSSNSILFFKLNNANTAFEILNISVNNLDVSVYTS